MEKDIEREILRLKEKGLSRLCVDREIQNIAALTLEINNLKKEKSVVIPVHVYQRPEIIIGISDFVGDSYKLAKECSNVDAENIVFCGVKFMAETAKILNPKKRVFIPNPEAGCSLSDSITAGDVIRLREKYPDAAVVTYINTSAEVKAVSDVVVTSSSALRILTKMFERYKRVIFIPDKYMAGNLARILGKEIGKDMIVWDGSCIVHENFDPSLIREYRKKYPSMLVLAHSECPSEVINEVDFMGSTSEMLTMIEKTNSSHYMLVTECGLGELAITKFPEKNFIAMCRLCKYMKMITLDDVLYTIKNFPPEREITLDEDVIEGARRSIDRMFVLAEP